MQAKLPPWRSPIVEALHSAAHISASREIDQIHECIIRAGPHTSYQLIEQVV